MSLVTVQSETKRKSQFGPPLKPSELKVKLGLTFRINTVDYQECQKMAIYLHELGVIKRPTVSCFAHAALFKWYNEVNEKLGEGKNA